MQHAPCRFFVLQVNLYVVPQESSASPRRKVAASASADPDHLVLSHFKHSEQAWCESAHALATDFLLLKKKQQLTVSAADMAPSFGWAHCQDK